MKRSKLERYRIVKLEIDNLREKIHKAEDDIARVIEIGTVKDRVYGGEGGIQGFNIEGFPTGLYERRLQSLRRLQYKLCEMETELTDTANEVVDFMRTIDDPRERMVFNLIYLDGLTQEKAGEKLYMSQSTISRIVLKYLEDD